VVSTATCYTLLFDVTNLIFIAIGISSYDINISKHVKTTVMLALESCFVIDKGKSFEIQTVL
jgi:hypothetical protein